MKIENKGTIASVQGGIHVPVDITAIEQGFERLLVIVVKPEVVDSRLLVLQSRVRVEISRIDILRG